MRKLCGLLAIAIAMVLPAGLSAQGGTVTGRVVDRVTQRPLADVQVGIANTTRGTLTNEDGEFSISNVPPGTIQVRASRIGYQQGTQTINLMPGQTANVTLALNQAVVQLGALVVSATGQEQRVREIGNAVSTIDMDEVELAPIQNFSQLLQGRTPGLAVLPNSGSVGTGSRIQIRGLSSVSLSSTPLIIIDGVRVSNETESTELFTGGQRVSRLDDLNSQDIESIEILKGPAASALYGTAAANGVIQITTRRGQRGGSQIRVYGQHSSMKLLASRIPTNFRARGRSATGARVDCDLTNRANGNCVTLDSIYEFNPLVDAENSPLRTGSLDKFGANVSGGTTSGDLTYYVSGERDQGPGITTNNKLDRVNLRANLSALVNSKLRLTASSGFVTSHIVLPQNDNSGGGIFTNALLGSPDPTNVARGQGFRSPYTPLNVSFWDNEEDLRRFTGSFNADWSPLSWLTFNATTGIDQVNRFEKGFIDLNSSQTGFFAQGLREQWRASDRELTATLNGSMVHDFLDGTITSTTAGGVQYNDQFSDITYAAGQNVAPGTKSAAEPLSASEAVGGNKLFGVYGSQQISYADRIFVTAAIRGDQNSAFGENIGFITYPALSASWVVLDEPWFPNLDVVSNFRLRGAYGESGLRPPRLAALRTYTDQAAALDGGAVPGFVVDNVGNADIEAEVTTELEFGADLGLLDDRLGLEITHYSKETDNALIQRPLAASLGGPPGSQFAGGEGSQYFNLGTVRNRGWEGAIRAEPLRLENVALNLQFNFTTNRNRLISLGDTTLPPIIVGGGFQENKAGYPVAGFWAPSYSYADANGDGFIQLAEVRRNPRVCTPAAVQPCVQQDDTINNSSFIGPSRPTREMAFSGDLTVFQGLRLSALMDHKGGHYIFNWGRRNRCGEATNSWCEERQVPDAASLEEQAEIMARRGGLGSYGFIEKADFWKLREVSLSYSLPESIMERIPASEALSITLSARNLKTWTDYRGMDPELNLPGQTDGTNDPGRQFVADNFTVPAPRTLTVRVDASL